MRNYFSNLFKRLKWKKNSSSKVINPERYTSNSGSSNFWLFYLFSSISDGYSSGSSDSSDSSSD